jgi:hypothetical protein
MFSGFLLVVMSALFAGCGALKKAAKKELNENTVTLVPPPGTYTYKPWITLKTQVDGLRGGIVKVKSPGKSEFSTGLMCGLVSPYASSDIYQRCVEVEQSGPLAYFLWNWAAKTEETVVDYTVNLSTNNLAGSFVAGAGKVPETIEFAELQSYCQYANDGHRLNVSIQLANDKHLTAERYAYLLFSIKDPVAGVNQVYTKENETMVTLRIKPRSDNPQAPGNDFSADYSSSSFFKDDPIISVSPTIQLDISGTSGVSSEAVAPKCELTMETAELGGVNKGTLKCSNLTYNHSEADPSLGAYVDIRGSWQCDKYTR